MMVITVFHAMAGTGQAADADIAKIEQEILDHGYLRLTTSNIAAAHPSMTSASGAIHIAWSDSISSGARLAYKSSSDGGESFTGDRAISDAFLSIDDVRIAASDDGVRVAVVAEVCRSDAAAEEVCMVLSEDGGASWSQVLFLGEGHVPTASYCDERLVVGFASGGKEPSYAAVAVERDERGLNGTWLFRAPLGEGDGSIACAAESVHFLFCPVSNPGVVAYGEVGLKGEVRTNLTMVRSGEDEVLSASMLIASSVPYVVLSVLKGSSSSLILASPVGNGDPWPQHLLAEISGTVREVAAEAHGKGIAVAFATQQDPSSISIMECALDGTMSAEPMPLSTGGAESSCPSVAGNGKTIACVWQEEHGKGSELVFATDAFFEEPDLKGLKKALSDTSHTSILSSDTELKSSISEDLVRLEALIDSSEEGKAVALIDDMLGTIGAKKMPASVDPKVASKDADDVSKVLGVLEATRASLLYPAVVELPKVDLSQEYIYDLKVDVIDATSSSISWFTSTGTEGDEVSLLAFGQDDATTTTQANQGRYHRIDVVTQANATYNFTCRSWLGAEDLEAQGAFTSGLAIENLTVSGNGSSCSVEWTTSSVCGAALSYAPMGGSLALSPMSTTDGSRHSSTLQNLTPGMSYSISVICTSDLFPQASSSASATFETPQQSEEAQEIVAEVTPRIGHGSMPSQFGASPPYVSITNVAYSILGPHTTRVTWTTNVVATSVVEYGLTTSYGLTATGANSSSHTVDLTGLDAFAPYHFRARSVEVGDPTDSAVSADYQFRMVYNDDNRGSDAGNTFATAMRTAAGLHGGWLDSSSDSADYYSINLAIGQLLSSRLVVPSGYDYNLYIYNPSNALKASSTNSGSMAETASYTADVAGLWAVAITRVTAPAQGIYLLWTNVTGGFDSFNLDVGGTGDNDAVGRLPGLAILDGTGWSAISGGKRDAVANSAFVLNLNPSSYQAYTDYLITIRYTSSAGTSIQVLSGGSWATVASLPSSTSWTSRSFLLGSSLLSDGIPDTQAGMNVKLRFSAAASVASMNALAYGYCSGVTFASAEHVPGTVLETGWTVNSLGVANATTGATLLVSLPRTDLTYVVQFIYLNSTQGQEVQQLTASSTWKGLGKLARWGRGASVVLDPTYYDVDSSSPGYNIRIKLLSPLYNLTGVRVTPSLVSTDVGVSGDDAATSHIFGASIYPSSEWSSGTSVDGRTVRYTTCTTANIYVNGAWSAKAYEVIMTYKTSNLGYIRQWSGSSYYNLIALVADGQWHDVTFKTRADIMYDYEAGSAINMLLEVTSSTCYVDKLSVSVDTDGDTYSDSAESLRLYDYDSATYSGDKTKTFNTPVYGPIKISFTITIYSYSSGIVYVDGTSIWSGSSAGIYSPAIIRTLAAGAHTFFVDITGSGNTKYIKFVNAYDLDTFSNDTDGDGLLDGVELSGGTSPCKADSDSDGLADGSELYSQVWSTDNLYSIPDNGQTTNRVVVKFTLPALSAPLTAVWLQVGILHPIASQVKVKIQRGTGTTYTLYDRVAGVNVFKSWNLLTSGYGLSDFTSSATWTIYVEDYASGTIGRVEYAKIQADGKTDALDDDSDNDGIKDGEEVQFGVDGWCTNPRSTDSDGDGVTDQNEINGVTPCSSATDPTRNDTDDDGYLDNQDLYMGDMVVKLTILEYKSIEDINLSNHRNIFFVVYAPTGTFATKRKNDAYTGTTYTLNWVYDVDVADTATTATFDMDAVADNAGTLGDDIKLDGAPGSALNLHTVFTISSTPQTVTSQGSQDLFDGDSDCYMKIKLEKAVKSRANLIVINGSDGSGGYGFYKVSTNNYRFNADQQVYVIDLNVASAGGHFTAGINTILVPRAIALECKLNYTLENLGSISSSHPLYGASFVYTNTSQAVSSAHVVVVISKNVTYSQGESLLYDLTHDSSNARIGNNVTISSTNIYLLHLPKDVLEAVPMNVENAGLGAGPNYLDPLGVIVSLLLFPILCAFFVLGTLLVLTFLIIDLGLKILGQIASAAATVIKQAVDKLVEALNAFVNWLIAFATQVLQALFAPLIAPVQNAIDSYVGGVVSATCAIDAEAHSKGTVSAVAGTQLLSALTGDFFAIVVIVAVAVSLGLLALQIITGGMSFVITTIIGIVVGYIISEVLKAAQQGAFDGLIPPIDMSGIQQWIEDLLGDRMPSDTQTGVTAFSFCMDVAGIFYGFGTFVLKGANFANECLWLIYSIISMVISLEACALNSDLFALLALAIAGGALAHSILEIKKSSSANGKIVNAISAGFGGIAVVTDLLFFDS